MMDLRVLRLEEEVTGELIWDRGGTMCCGPMQQQGAAC